MIHSRGPESMTEAVLSDSFASSDSDENDREHNTSTHHDHDLERDDPCSSPYTESHVCLMSHLSSFSKGVDACSISQPAKMSRNRVKLHYFMHYFNRGSFDRLLPPESSNEHYTGYSCKMCSKHFYNKNGSTLGRLAVLCHLALDHGLLLDTMVRDEEVKMDEVINLLYHIDPNTKAIMDKGIIYRVKTTDVIRHKAMHKTTEGAKSVLNDRSAIKPNITSRNSIVDTSPKEPDSTLRNNEFSDNLECRPTFRYKSKANRHQRETKSLLDPLPALSSGLKSKPYIRKRPKLNINWDDDDESEEWSESESVGKRAKKGKKKKRTDTQDELGTVKSRFLPKRLASKRNITQVDSTDDEDNDENHDT